MGYNISSLPDFASEGKAFVVKSILESQTIKVLTAGGSFDPTAKGINHIQLLDTDVVIQDGSSCGFDANGGAVLSQATLTINDLKINNEYCSRDLERTWAVGELQKGQEYNEIVFLTDIVSNSTDKASFALEQMVWQGDTGATASGNLSMIDGFIKQIKAGSYLPLTGATAGATTLAKLQKVSALMPVAVSAQDDFRVFIGQDTYNQMIADLAALNIYKPTDDMTIYGTTTKVQIVNGLNGGHVVAARVRNLRAGGEMTAIEFKNWYSQDFDVLRLSSRFSLGVCPVYVEEIGYVKIA